MVNVCLPLRGRVVRRLVSNVLMRCAHSRGTARWLSSLIAAFGLAATTHAQIFTQAINLLSAAPENSWVNLTTNRLDSVWTPIALRYDLSATPDTLVTAWGGMVWDTTRYKLYLHGGGHANYGGNEVYAWDLATGAWQRASLPSAMIIPDNPIDPPGSAGDVTWASVKPVDGDSKAAPPSCHQYASPHYLPIIDRAVYFCGASFESGRTGIYQFGTNSSTRTYPGPFLWDPSKADPMKVGGSQGSHVRTSPTYAAANSIAAGNMWQARGKWESMAIGTGAAFLNSSSAYRVEGGKDVLYVVSGIDNEGSALYLYRYAFNDLNNPAADTWTKVGQYYGFAEGGGGGVIHPTLNVYVRPAGIGSSFLYWDLSPSATANPETNNEFEIIPSGAGAFADADLSALTWDSHRNVITVWNGGNDVWRLVAPATVSPNGWSMQRITPSNAGPSLVLAQGMQNRFKYVPELDAFLALADGTSGAVWAYKPAGWSPTAPPSVCDLDIDGDGTRSALVDGVLLLRHMAGFTGAGLTANLTFAGNAQRTDPTAISNFLNANVYDADGDGAQKLTVDGLLFARLMRGLSDSALASAITFPVGSQFTSGAAIRAHVNATCAHAGF